MTLKEAIAILDAKRMDDLDRRAPDSAEACRLGIEALKREEHTRMFHHDQWEGLLLGETKE
ncbi:MAG: hypothetical protein ABSF21_01770 [Dehalococcoidia bacterium]